MNNLILIICYFGKFPSYFSLFLESCRWNSNIDWLIITDDHTSYKYPKNVHVKYSSLLEIEKLAKNKIGDWINLKRPYKLCDFRPAFGLLFQEDIKDYKYWGHCDIDVIWGNLQETLSPLLEKEYLRLFKYGHLSVYLNTLQNNELFKLPYSRVQYKEVLSTNISCGFDEQNGSWLLAKENNIYCHHQTICFDLKRPSKDNLLKSYSTPNFENQCFIIENRHIYQYFKDKKGEIQRFEQAYIHFQRRNPTFSDMDIGRSVFQLTQNHIIALDNNWDIEKAFSRNVQNISPFSLIRQFIKDYKQFLKSKLFTGFCAFKRNKIL